MSFITILMSALRNISDVSFANNFRAAVLAAMKEMFKKLGLAGIELIGNEGDDVNIISSIVSTTPMKNFFKLYGLEAVRDYTGWHLAGYEKTYFGTRPLGFSFETFSTEEEVYLNVVTALHDSRFGPAMADLDLSDEEIFQALLS